MQTIFNFVKEQRTRYRAYTIEIADGYEYSQYQTLRTIELYHNSKFLTGNLDSLKTREALLQRHQIPRERCDAQRTSIPKASGIEPSV